MRVFGRLAKIESVWVGNRRSIVVPLPSRAVSCDAKKGGGLLADVPKLQPWQTTEVIMQHLLMIESYRRAAGKPLIENAEIENIADVLFNAPFAILAHNRFAPNVPDEEAVYTYANQAALDAFEADSYHDLVGVRSTVCVKGIEDTEFDDREEFLKSIVPTAPQAAAAAPAEDGSDSEEVEGDRERVDASGMKTAAYKGRRTGLKGRIFEVEAQLWNIMSPTGTVVGQAAWFDSYKLEDGTVVNCGADPEVDVAEVSPEALAAAEAAVEEQASVVRTLKEQQGLANKSPEVQEAVEELLRRKERLQALQAAGAPQAVEAAA